MKYLKVLIFSLTLCAVMTLASFAAGSVSAPGGSVSSAQDFVDALGGSDAAYADGGNIILLSDITLGGTVEIVEGSYTISGRGCYITRTMPEALFSIGNGTMLTLGDKGGSDSDPSLTLDGSGAVGAAAMITLDGGTMYMYPGTLLTGAENNLTAGISTSMGGGAVCVLLGEFDMYGGAINNCSADSGGGVAVLGGTFMQSGGTVSGCSATYGGAVYVGENGAYSAGGIAISKNSASCGGAVYSYGSLTLAQCEISYDTAKSQGGGIYIAGGTFDMVGGYIGYCGAGEIVIDSTDLTSSDTTVTGGQGGALFGEGAMSLYSVQLVSNTAARGSAVYVSADSLTLSECTLNYNAAAECATLYVASGADAVLSGGNLSSNDADSYCGGAVIFGSLTVDGGSISSNRCKNGFAYALGVLDAGSVTVKNGAFISFNNDVGMTENAAFTVENELTANTPVATLTPLGESADPAVPYAVNYQVGKALVGGDLTQLDKLAVSDYDGRAYTFGESGELKANGRAADAPFPYLTVVMVCVIVAAAAGLIVIFVRAAKGGKAKGK